MNVRPKLNARISVQNFKDYYWHKLELIDFCRTENLDKRGGKIELANRIAKFLETGDREPYQAIVSKTSRFDWNSGKLTIETEITETTCTSI